MMGCDTNLGDSTTNDEQASRAFTVSPLAGVRIVSGDGVFALSEAESPKGFSSQSPGTLAWWNDASSQQMFLYGRLVISPSDMGHALLNLERDLGIDLSFTDESAELKRAMHKAGIEPPDPTTWQPATYALALEVMGFDPSDFLEVGKGQYVAVDCRMAKSIAATEATLKSLPSPMKAILLGSQARCGGGSGPIPDDTPCLGDIDCDGIPDGEDPDIDGDGIPNGEDNDVDGDGIPNGNDGDVDGDGTPNGDDNDVDGDGIDNGGDSDLDGDGTPNSGDGDADGDGIPNPDDPDADGDGTPNPDDPTPNGCTTDCSGACCNKSTGYCSIKAKSACSATLEFFAGTDKICNPNPCCIQAENPSFPLTDATITHITIPIPPNTPDDVWGETGTLRIDLDGSVACDGTQWCAVLDGIDGDYYEWYRLLPGVVEVTGPPPGNTTEQNHCNQTFDLDSLGGANWYMIDAVHAHEDVHAAHLLPALQAVTLTIEALYEVFCVPHESGMTESDAKNAIEGLNGWNDLEDDALIIWDREYKNLSANDESGPTAQAERAVVDPMIDSICTLNNQQCWAICLACPARPTTPDGACCAPETGVCNLKTECRCLDEGGEYRGDNTTCVPINPCKGACCAPDNSCTESTESRCISVIGGTYQGDSTTCATTGCGPAG